MVTQVALQAGFRSYTALVQAHKHPFFQIILPSRGVLDLEIDGRGGRIEGDRAAVIGTGDRHAYSAMTGANRFLVLDVFDPARMPADKNSRDLLEKLAERRYLALTPAAHSLVGYAEQTFACSGATAPDTSHLAALWLPLLLEALSPKARPADRAVQALARAKTFIDRFYDQPIRTPDLARIAGLGASRLHELFQVRLETTPHRYLMDVRLRRALALLETTQLSIAEIAARTGHADQSALTRHLRRSRGITPAAYRQALGPAAQASVETAHSCGESVKRH